MSEDNPVDRENPLERALAYAKTPPAFPPRQIRTTEEARQAVASFEVQYGGLFELARRRHEERRAS